MSLCLKRSNNAFIVSYDREVEREREGEREKKRKGGGEREGGREGDRWIKVKPSLLLHNRCTNSSLCSSAHLLL